MKKLAILILFSLKVFGQEEQFISFEAQVKDFCKYNHKTESHQKFDTLVPNPTREIKLDKSGSEFSVGFPIDSEMVFINYKVSKTDVITHNSDKKQYRYYLGYDEDGFPLVLYVSLDNKNAMFYYFYTVALNTFSKSERMELNEKQFLKLTTNN